MILFISAKYGNKADTVSLIQAAQRRGIHTSTLLNSWDPEKEFNTYGVSKEHCALYGEHAFCEFIAQEMHWNLYSNSLDWITKIQPNFLKRGVFYKTLDEAIDIEAHDRSILGKRVLEPADDICFQPGVYPDKFPLAPRDTKILIHTDVEWLTKYRFVIINGKIETFCCYRVANVCNEPTIRDMVFTGKGVTAEAFVKTLLSHNNVAPACVIDVGFMKNDGGWSVCGTYPVWSSELYGCDPDKFLKALFVACESIN